MIGLSGRNQLVALLWSALLAALLPVNAPAQGAAADESPPVASHHDLVIFDGERPFFLRLDIRVSHEPQADRWLADVRRQFALFDADGDGAITTAELQEPAAGDGLPAGNPSRRGMPELSEADVAPFDGWITLEEFAALIRSQGNGPTQFVAPGSGQARNESDLGQRLFAMLDRDADNRLSRAELAAAAGSFRRIDFDEDGTISAEELQSGDPYYGAYSRGVDRGRAPGLPIFSLTAGDSATELARQILDRYGDVRGSIGPGAAGLQPETFERNDVDGNGELDFDELRYFLCNPVPTLVLTVDLGHSDVKSPPVAVWPPDAEPPVPVRTSETGLVSLVLPLGQIELRCLEPASDEEITSVLKTTFQGLDRDSNLYLEQKEVAADQVIGPVFSACDQNGDGQLFEDELLAVFAESLQSARSRAQVSAVDRGQDLFAILDADGNRRIGAGEFDSLIRRIDLWDDDGDGAIRPAEVPHVYQLSIGPGQPSIAGRTLPIATGNVAIPGAPEAAAPAWFAGMDRNADGRLSASEFLGSADDFQQIDRDNDGRIDVAEASRIQP